MENKLSLEQALEMTRNSLAELNIPVTLVNQIGIPVSRAISNLDACIDAIRQRVAQEPTMTIEPMPEGEAPEESDEDGAADA